MKIKTDIRGFQPRINMIEFQSYASDVENIRDPWTTIQAYSKQRIFGVFNLESI